MGNSLCQLVLWILPRFSLGRGASSIDKTRQAFFPVLAGSERWRKHFIVPDNIEQLADGADENSAVPASPQASLNLSTLITVPVAIDICCQLRYQLGTTHHHTHVSVSAAHCHSQSH